MKYSFDKHKIHHLRDNSRENKYLECLYFPIPLISNYLHSNSYSISHNEWNKIRVGLTSMASMYGNVHHIFRCCLTAIVWGVHFMLCNDESCCFSNKKTRGIHPKPKVHSTKPKNSTFFQHLQKVCFAPFLLEFTALYQVHCTTIG